MQNSQKHFVFTYTTAMFGLWSGYANHDEPIINHVLLIFKLRVYNLREKHRLNMMNLHNNIKEIKKTEYCLGSNSQKKTDISK